MSNNLAASLYRQCKSSRDLAVATARPRQSCVVHNGPYLSARSSAPPPPEQYDEWLTAVRSTDSRSRTKMSGSKLRRAVVMRRNGCSWPEVITAVGCASVKKWALALPPELAI